jgi:RNA polymerase sigma factor (sigma-70 family)
MVGATALSLEGLVAVDADVVRLRRGDLNALSELITRYQNRLYRYLLRLVRQPAEAEDLFQQTWLKVVEKIRSFDASRNFDAWLFTLARNLAIDHLRRIRPQSLDEPLATAGIAKPWRTGFRVKTTRRSITRWRPSAERR